MRRSRTLLRTSRSSPPLSLSLSLARSLSLYMYRRPPGTLYQCAASVNRCSVASIYGRWMCRHAGFVASAEGRIAIRKTSSQLRPGNLTFDERLHRLHLAGAWFGDPNPTVKYGPFIKSQLTRTQLTLRPYVVHIWSRDPPISGGTETFLVRRADPTGDPRS